MRQSLSGLIPLLLVAAACGPDQPPAEPRLEPVPSVEALPPVGPDDGLTMIFHGSFSSESLDDKWWHPTGGFSTHLNDEVGNVWTIRDRGRVIHLYPTSWPSMRPTSANLARAGALLAHTFRAIAEDNPPPVDIIAHSHGGNVVLYALAEIAEEQANDPSLSPLHVRNLVFLATPHIVRSEQLRHWPNDIEHPLFDMYDQVVNIYTEEDFISGTIAGLFTRGEAEFRLDRFEIPRAIDIQIQTDVGGSDAHHVLHSNVMATLLGQALDGEIPWEEASFPELTDEDDKGNTP